jgi:hypothetical protein
LKQRKRKTKKRKERQINEISLVYISVPLFYGERQRGSIKAPSSVKGKLEYYSAVKINCSPASFVFLKN